jgi:Tol biopolymer transport system component
MTRRRTLFCASRCLLVALMVTASAPAQAAHPGRPGPVAYSQSTTTVNADFVVETSGGLFGHGPRQSQRPFQLTSGLGDEAPSYSADGRWIAFERSAAGAEGSHIYLMRSEGTGVRQLTSGPHEDSNPYFSPDGRRVVFDRSVRSRGATNVFVVSASGGSVRQLTFGRDASREPAFTPSGKRIVFVSNRDADGGRDRGDIWAMGGDGTNQRLLIDGPYAEFQPDVAPNGRRIAFVSDRRGTTNLYVARPNGRRVRALTRSSGDCNPCYSAPAWSPSGRHLVALSSSRFSSAILVVRADGRKFTKFASGIREVEGYGTTLEAPTWGPAPR